MNLFGWLLNPGIGSESVSTSDLRNPRYWLQDWTGRKSLAGVSVNAHTAITVGSVFACIRNISEDVAKLPMILYERAGEGKNRATDDPRYKLVRSRPNETQTAFMFRSTVTGWAILRGSGVAAINRDAVGRPLSLTPIHPSQLRIYREPDGRLLYRVRTRAGEAILEHDDVIHVAGFSDDGVLGHMLADLAQESIGLAMAAERYAATYFGNGATLGGILKTPGQLSEKGTEKLRESWKALHGGPDKAHETAILEEGMTWEATSGTPKESQGIEYRQFSIEEVARWFRMPPHKIGHLQRSTFSNIEHQAMEYVTDTLQPWCVRWEQECDRKLLGQDEPLFYEHLLDALLRGDTVSRTGALSTQFLNGAITLNEWRAIENRNPLPPELGDVHFVPLNLTPIEKAIAQKDAKPEPVPPPAPPPAPPPPAPDKDEDKDEDEDAAVAPVFRDAFARVLTKERNALARKGASLASDFYDRQQSFMAEAISPGMAAWCAIRGLAADAEDLHAAAATFATLHCVQEPTSAEDVIGKAEILTASLLTALRTGI